MIMSCEGVDSMVPLHDVVYDVYVFTPQHSCLLIVLTDGQMARLYYLSGRLDTAMVYTHRMADIQQRVTHYQ